MEKIPTLLITDFVHAIFIFLCISAELWIRGSHLLIIDIKMSYKLVQFHAKIIVYTNFIRKLHNLSYVICINTQHKVKELRTTTPHSKTTGHTVNYIWESYLEKSQILKKGKRLLKVS